MRPLFQILLLFILSVAFSPKADATLRARAVPLSGVALGAKSVALTLNFGEPVNGVSFPGWQDSQGLWSASPELVPGSYSLTAVATHPSGWVPQGVNHQFTVAPRAETVANTYDAMGNVQTRTWSTGKVQSFAWDAQGRLSSVYQTGGTPASWWAVYDGLGRRIYTQVNGAFATRSVYDPEVEFLELGLQINGAQAWEIYGPDMSGSYGGMQELGGLEAVIGTDGVTRGIINDWWGNTVGYVAAPGGAMTRGPARFTGFGPEPGRGMSPMTATKPLHELLGYRGLTLDPPGYFHMGTRSYDPQSGRWLSPDPMGHAGSLSLYDYCDNDPLNVFDPDGRFGKGIHDGWNGTSGANSPNSGAYHAAMSLSGTVGGVGGGLAQGKAILGNALTLGTNAELSAYTNSLSGWQYSASRGFMGVGAATGGTALALLSAPVVVSAGTTVLATGQTAVATGSVMTALQSQQGQRLVGWGTTAAEVYLSSYTGVSPVGVPLPAAKTLPPLRQQYIDDVASLSDLASRASGANAAATARLLHAERNALKLQYRELTPPDLLKTIEARNTKLYGNPLGPSIDQLRAAGKSWDDIIESATRAGGSDIKF